MIATKIHTFVYTSQKNGLLLDCDHKIVTKIRIFFNRKSRKFSLPECFQSWGGGGGREDLKLEKQNEKSAMFSACVLPVCRKEGNQNIESYMAQGLITCRMS